MISFSRWTLSSGWQTAADYSSAAPLEWIVYRELSSREQKHARAKSGRVQRGGTFCVHNEQRLLNLFNTHGLQEERLLCSSTQLTNIYSLLQLSLRPGSELTLTPRTPRTPLTPRTGFCVFTCWCWRFPPHKNVLKTRKCLMSASSGFVTI